MEEPIPATEAIETVPLARRTWAIWLAVAGLGVLLCAAGFIGALIFAGPGLMEKFLPDHVQPAAGQVRDITHSNTMGDPDAPIHMIEYGDFQCPYCLRFWEETEPQLIEEYVNTGKVYFEFRSYPIIGPESTAAAEAAYCAGDQGKFWEYHDTLFTNWTGENAGDFTREKLRGYAESVKLDVKLFEQCMDEEKHKETVDQDMVNAQKDGVHATPTFIINGEKVEGTQPFSVLKHILQEMLNGGLDTGSG
jgi:protein-disulfide isomerase